MEAAVAKNQEVLRMRSTRSQDPSTRPSAKCTKSHASHYEKKQALSLPPKLNRTTFRTSREMDFLSEKELVTQTGHGVSEWPLVIVKELMDNALDACEDIDTEPVIDVVADASGISVIDNGPGLPEATLEGAFDFSVRASNREAYVAPDRGAQGNALMTLLAMPKVLDSDAGRLIVEAHGKRHVITCGTDPISQRAVVHDDVSDVPKCKNRQSKDGTNKQALSGTTIRVEWTSRHDEDGDVVWPFGSGGFAGRFEQRFRMLVEGYAVFNPHATISLDWFGKRSEWNATDTSWSKWKPCKPTSPHWYETSHLERLIGAYITHDRDAGSDRLVSDLLSEFDGLTGSQKRTKVLVDADAKRVKLSELAVDGELDKPRIARLLASMQSHTRPVKSKRLGVIGEDHLRARLLGMGIESDSFQYSRKVGNDGLPWVLESAFGYRGDCESSRLIFSGANWSAAINNPFRSFGGTGEGLEAVLADMRAGRSEPIVLHLAHPRVEYTDRGKSALVIGGNEQ
jgi:DNA topoisomerase VI subunit B